MATPVIISNPVNPANPASNPFRPDQRIWIALDPGTCFYDGFDTALDTTNRWTAAGTTPTITNGILTISPSTTALAVSSLTSQPTFQLLGNMFIAALGVWKVDATAKTGNYRFFGLGSPAGSPTVAAPITNACGFEYNATDGTLGYVYWAGGVRTQVNGITNPATTQVNATLSNGDEHRYQVYFKTSTVYWEVDGVTMAQATQPELQSSTLSVFSLSVNGAATVTPAAVSTFSFIGVGDTASNGTQLNDGQFPWRKGQIGADSSLSTKNVGAFYPTYSAAGQAVTTTLSTDLAVISGSATKTVYVTKVIATAIQTVAGAVETFLVKRSSTGTAGTPTSLTQVPHDSTDTAGTAALCAVYTTTVTPGTSVGAIKRAYLPASPVTVAPQPITLFELGDKGKPIILRGIAQNLCININGVTVAGGTFDVSFEWYEI